MTNGNGSFLRPRRNGEEVPLPATDENVYRFYDTTTASYTHRGSLFNIFNMGSHVHNYSNNIFAFKFIYKIMMSTFSFM